MKPKVLSGLLFCFLFLVPLVHGGDGPRIEKFSPQGVIKGIRQVSVRFSEAIVPLGDPRAAADPFAFQCPGKGTGRWVDDRNWVLDFEKDLPAGIQCEFSLQPDLQTLSGKEIIGPKHFSFSTGGPNILRSTPFDGDERIDEEQIFILTVDAEPTRETLLEKVSFSIEGIQDRVGIQLIEGKQRERILKARYRKIPEQPLLLLQSRQRFPAESRVSLIWGKGIRAETGVETEKDQILNFKTRRAFTAEFQCQRENPRVGCIPLKSMTVQFSAPIPKGQAGKIILKGPGGKSWKPVLGETGTLNAVSFKGPFPERASFILEIPMGLTDDAGRSLENRDQFPLTVQTYRYPPLAKFSSRFGILELKADPILPMTLRNLDPQIKGRMVKASPEEAVFGEVKGKAINVAPRNGDEVQAWLRKVGSASRDTSILKGEKGAKELPVAKPRGTQAFEVVGIPLQEPGLYIIELESNLLGKALLNAPKPAFVPTAVLVTNLAVHFKWARESSVVWVTALDSGDPVPNAKVTVKDCQERILWKGTTDPMGLARIEEPLPTLQDLPRCKYEPDRFDDRQMGALQGLESGLLVMAQTGDDMAFVHSSWIQGIEPWRFQLPEESFRGPVLTHTIFDRTLLRAGETVHMKHLLRRHTGKGISIPPQNQMPDFISIVHYGSNTRYEFPLHWDGGGVAETTWKIPQDAKLGIYGVNLTLKSDPKHREEWTSGEFRVEEFRVPLLKAVIQPPKDPLVNALEMPFLLNVQYLAGGGAGQLPIKLRSEITSKWISPFEGFENFIFANGGAKEGRVRRGEPIDEEEEGDREEEMGDPRKPVKMPPVDLILDSTGSTATTIRKIPTFETPREIFTEIEFKDPNGEIQTVSSRVPLWPAKYLIGIKGDSWTTSKGLLKAQVAVVDLAGRPMADVPVKVDLLEKKTFSHRKRLVGGFYAYEHIVETKKIALACEGKTEAGGLLLCEARSPVSGSVILQAQAVDEAGNPTAAHWEVWVAGEAEWWFEVSDHDRIDLIPEKKRYEPGETAFFQVRMPFREATALVAVEREGVVETTVQKISGKHPVVAVPVKGSYAPNVFVSILALRGRVSEVRPTAMVDLGKPAHKLGIAEIKVGWKDHELKVTVTPERSVYKVREKVKVKIGARPIDGRIPLRGGEVTLAAVDEGLLELMPNRSWQVLPAMMGRRGYGVFTSTAQGQVIGKRHFGRKALAPGGGGGRQMTRELFDTLLFWKARLPLDENGEASAEIPLNDSITSFRIVAVATAGESLFGTGSASIQSTQDLMILSGLAPLVREGDRFKAEFTVRNSTKRAMAIEVLAVAQGLSGRLEKQGFSLSPGEAKDVGWEVTAPMGLESIRWEVEVGEKGSTERDRIRVRQRIVPVVAVRTFQATVAQTEKAFDFSVERPKDALPGRGGIQMTLRPRIGDGLGGVIDYMKRYPYGCLEQKISRAVALQDENLWKERMADLASHIDSDGLAKYFPSLTYGDPNLTAYILAIGHEAGWVIPKETKEKMENGLLKYVNGTIRRSSLVRTADLTLRKLTAIEALSRSGKMDPKLLGSIAIEPNLWPTSGVIDWLNILLNVPAIPDRENRMKEVESIIRSRLQFQGTVMGFSTEKNDPLWWLMVSGDLNAVRILLPLIRLEGWKKDMPRLVRGALGRQKRGAWDLTLANAWGVLAMEKFSEAFEKEPLSGTTRVLLMGETNAFDWQKASEGGGLFFPWPPKKEELSISHQGGGKPWVTIQSLAAIPLKGALSSGYHIQKTILPIQQKEPGKWSRGDILRVRLELESQADQTWVVVSDPIPSGSTILGSGLGRDSTLRVQDEERKGWVWPAYEERSFEAFRAYYDYVPKGKWTVEYTVRLNQGGIMHIPTTRVEALYFPEMFGEVPNAPIEVQP